MAIYFISWLLGQKRICVHFIHVVGFACKAALLIGIAHYMHGVHVCTWLTGEHASSKVCEVSLFFSSCRLYSWWRSLFVSDPHPWAKDRERESEGKFRCHLTEYPELESSQCSPASAEFSVTRHWPLQSTVGALHCFLFLLENSYTDWTKDFCFLTSTYLPCPLESHRPVLGR